MEDIDNKIQDLKLKIEEERNPVKLSIFKRHLRDLQEHRDRIKMFKNFNELNDK